MYLYKELLKSLDEKSQESIKDALLKKHFHENMEILELISKDINGDFLFNGKLISSSWDSIENKPEKIVTDISQTETGLSISYSDATKEDIEISGGSSSITAVGLTTSEW